MMVLHHRNIALGLITILNFHETVHFRHPPESAIEAEARYRFLLLALSGPSVIMNATAVDVQKGRSDLNGSV